MTNGLLERAKQSNKPPEKLLLDICQVLIFCVEFRELFHLIRDLSQAEKKMNIVKLSKNAQNGIYFTQNGQIVISVKIVVIFSSHIEKSHELNGTTPEIQHRK